MSKIRKSDKILLSCMMSVMKKYHKLMSAVAIIILLGGMLLSFSGCQKEKEIPWWHDSENLEFILEDERSQEKSFTYRKPFSEKIEFNYIQEKGNTVEYMPKLRILHKGEEKIFYTWVTKREKFSRYPGGFVDYDNPQTSVIVKEYGVYRVRLEHYMNIYYVSRFGEIVKEYKSKDFISANNIYIIIHKGEEQ